MTVRTQLESLGIKGKIWTHDHQTMIVGRLPPTVRQNYYYYKKRTGFEDSTGLREYDGRGIYTMIKAGGSNV
jgi:hypothetical protein